MSSRRVGQVVPANAFGFSVSLRVRHPKSDLGVLTEALRLEPEHSWVAGEPRRSQSGAPLGGPHRDSYWSALLPVPLGSAMPLEVFLGQQLLQLTRHRDCILELQADGGSFSLLIEISPGAQTAFALSSAVTRKLADLNLDVELNFVSD